MFISRTPYRVSFFGGGTDYPGWYRQEGGAVLATAIDRYCYISVRELPPFFDIRHRVVWSHIETVSSIAEILHPAVREGLHFLGFDDSIGLEIHHQGDLPARAGMGSSSAFAVGLIRVLFALRNREVEGRELARLAIELEQDVLKENVGCQDQVVTALGGTSRIEFTPEGDFHVERVGCSRQRLDELASRLLLVYTGRTRLSTDVAGAVLGGLASSATILREMRAQVDAGWKLLHGGSLDDFGRLLHEAWCCKRALNPAVSNDEIDALYATALRCGSLGGKLLGAGRAGFLLLYVPPEARRAVADALGARVQVLFRFEPNGSCILPTGAIA